MTLLPRQRKILCCHNFALAQPQSPSILRYPSPIPTVKRAQTHTMNLQPIKHLLRALLALFVFIVKLAEAGTVTVTIGEDAVNNRVFAGWVGSLSGLPPTPVNSFTYSGIWLDPDDTWVWSPNGATTCK
jgi:hypothetical protein